MSESAAQLEWYRFAAYAKLCGGYGVRVTEAEKLTDPPPGANDSMATYSFEDQRILFLRGRRGGFGKVAMMVMPAGGGEPEVLREEANLRGLLWRPDNRRIVFLTDTTLKEIDVVTKRTPSPMTKSTLWSRMPRRLLMRIASIAKPLKLAIRQTR